jgi:hypothetical protein
MIGIWNDAEYMSTRMCVLCVYSICCSWSKHRNPCSSSSLSLSLDKKKRRLVPSSFISLSSKATRADLKTRDRLLLAYKTHGRQTKKKGKNLYRWKADFNDPKTPGSLSLQPAHTRLYCVLLRFCKYIHGSEGGVLDRRYIDSTLKSLPYIIHYGNIRNEKEQKSS